jgi:preprotein translocase SecF subunit
MKQIDFLKYRWVVIIISLLVIVGGITYGLLTGYKFDIDFKGGVTISADVNEEFNNTDIENIVMEITGINPLVQKTSGGNNSVSISIEPIESEKIDQIVEALKAKYTNITEPSTRNIQPAYGKELLNSAILAVSVAVVVVLLYITIRFKTLGITAAITAILALVHDVLFVVAIYGIIKFPINSTFVAVVLTIVGYSINDTIVLYDKIRENKKKVTRSKDVRDTINLSISQTLGRTIVTSLTTVVTVIVVYIFATINSQQVLREFSLPLIIGVLVGTYSSIFIASSSWYMIDKVVLKIKEKFVANKKSKKRK